MKFQSTAAFLFSSAVACAAFAADPMPMAGHDADTTFFEKAASAGKLEVESGKLAAQRAGSPAIRDFAQMMVKDHSKADAELRALAAKKGVTLPSAMAAAHQKELDELRAEKAGKDFDGEFRDLMIDSHEEAVALFEKTAADSKDTDVRAFAAKMLPTLEHHESAAKALPKS